MGKKANNAAQSNLTGSADRFAKVAEDLYGESKGDRSTVRDFYGGIVKGGPEASKVLAPSMEGIERSYKTARTNLERYSPHGGALQKGYNDLAVAEAGDKGRLYNENLLGAVDKLYNLGTFGTSAGLTAGSGQLSAGTALGNLSAQQANQWAGGAQGVGSLIGKFAASSIEFKTAVQRFEDREAALQMVLAQRLATFEYLEEIEPGRKRHLGVIAEESVPQFVSVDNRHIDLVDVAGALIGAIQAQQSQIAELEARLERIRA